LIKFISLNGTSRAALVQARCDVLHHLRTAQALLAACAPHPRDYVGEEEQFQLDQQVHSDRQCHLIEIIGFIECEAEALNMLPGYDKGVKS
jgi:hypothetical protein